VRASLVNLLNKEKTMFTLDATIDAVQGAKKQFVNTFVQNETVAKALNEFVDAQSDYTKKAAKTSMDAATVLTQEMVRGVTEAAKFDYTKFGEGIMKAYNEMNRSAEKVSKAYSKKSA
jgi:hypothetical protein